MTLKPCIIYSFQFSKSISLTNIVKDKISDNKIDNKLVLPTKGWLRTIVSYLFAKSYKFLVVINSFKLY